VDIAHKRRSSAATVKVRNAAAVASTLIDLGVDPAIVLMKAGVEPATFANPENTLPYATLGRLVLACVEATGCDDFGLQVGVRSEPTIMGLTGIVSINSPTVRDGIGVILATLRTSDTGGQAFLSVRDGLASFGYTVVAAGIEAAEQIEDASVAIALNVMVNSLVRPGDRSEHGLRASRRATGDGSSSFLARRSSSTSREPVSSSTPRRWIRGLIVKIPLMRRSSPRCLNRLSARRRQISYQR
jgi:hypothetical protein